MKPVLPSGFCVALLLASGCTRDAGFTRLLEPAPSATDTSDPPEEQRDSGDTGTALPVCPQPELVSAVPGERDPSCANEEVRTALDATLEWSKGSFAAFPLYAHSYGAGAVGHITDDDGDGAHGSAGDIPDVVAIFYARSETGSICSTSTAEPHGVVRVLSGEDGTEHWSLGALPAPHTGLHVSPRFSTALGDVDADGRPEVVVGVWDGPEGTEQRVAALHHDGTVAWVSPPLGAPGSIELAEIYDLDQDGVPEVYANGHVLDGATGAVRWADRDLPNGPVVVADLEGDGTNELVTIAGIWEPDGTERCHHGLGGSDLAVADLDGDGRGEVVTTTSGSVAVTTEACRLEAFRYTSAQVPSLGDVDVDGLPEIVFGTYRGNELVALEADTSVLWQQNIGETNYAYTAATLFDFEGDGYLELIYAGRFQLRIHGGTDGTTRFIDPDHYSCPLRYDRPMPVDVDGDGSVEIVTVSTGGVRVYGDRLGGWVAGRPVWNQHGFSGSNVRADLSIPAEPGGNWPAYNQFRAGEPEANRGQASGLIDVKPAVVNVCEVECEQGTLQITLRGENAGMADAPDGLSIALYSLSDGADPALLEVVETPVPVRSGFSTEGVTVRISTADLPEGRLMLAADDDGTGASTIEECDETNNVLVLEDLCSDE